MAKKKNKKNKSLVAAVDNNSTNTAMQFFKDNAKQIGTTIAGLIVTEVVQATVEQLLQKVGNNNGNRDDSNRVTDSNNAEGSGRKADLQDVAASTFSNLKGKIKDAKEPVEASVNSVKATASEVPPALSGIAEIVRNAAQKAIAQSIDKLGDSLDTGTLTTQAVVAGASDSAKNLVGAIASNSGDKLPHKPKKKGKKKKK